MSEYQYYEFRAIDRPLTKKQLEEVGEYSTRAEITPTSFSNEYHWGNFRGDVTEFIEKYFDAMIYTANWGTHRFVLRVPVDIVDKSAIEDYLVDESVDMTVKAGNIILDLSSQSEDYDDDTDSGDWLSALISVRAEVLGGDRRPLYIAWLAGVQQGEVDDDETEPPVPAGLKTLTASQVDLAAFLRVGDDLLSVAAVDSPDLETPRPNGDFDQWLTALPVTEKDELLIALIGSADPLLPARLRQRFGTENKARVEPAAARRMVSQILAQAEQVRAEREAAATAEAARKRARKEAEAARERAAHLERLATRGDAPWSEVERLVETKQQGNYDVAVTLLKDLRDIAVQQGTATQFAMRIYRLIERHAKKTSFQQRLSKSKLVPQSSGAA